MKAISHDFSLKEARPQPLVAGCLRGNQDLNFDRKKMESGGEELVDQRGGGGGDAKVFNDGDVYEPYLVIIMNQL